MQNNEDEGIVIESQPNVSGVRGDLNFRMCVMLQINRCGAQLAKLPHEFMHPGSGELLGCTYDSILTSFCDGVELLEMLLAPYVDKQFTDAKENLGADYKKEKEKNVRAYFFKRFGNVITLCSRLGMLLEPITDEGI